MEFLKVKQVACKKVISVMHDDTIGDAVSKMYQSNHRDVVVRNDEENSYGILKVNDLIRMKIGNVDFQTKICEIKYDKIGTIDENAPVIKAMELIDKRTNCLCVVDAENNLAGYISYYDILATIDPKSIMEKQTIGDVMIKTMIKFAYEDESTISVIQRMEDDIDDCVILLDEWQNPTGIITTKDIVKLFGEQKDLHKPIDEYMSKPLQTVRSDLKINEALSFISQKHFKRLIVEGKDTRVVGQITQEDLIVKVYSKWAEQLKADSSQLKEINRVLEAKASKYETLAVTDRLTGTYNRVKFEQELQVEIDKIKRYSLNPFSLVLFDIDNFKSINDTHGHLAGDTVLRKLAKVVKESLRSSDIFARWGGEEFVVLLTFTAGKNGYEAAESLRKVIENAPMEMPVKKITCSFGITDFKEDDNVHSLLKRADDAMYQAKNSGKNKVVLL